MKILLIVLTLFFIADANAYSCVQADASGALWQSTDPNSECDYVLLTHDEYVNRDQALINTLNDLFLFDADDFALHHGFLAVTFVTCFGAGVVVRWLGKR